MKYVIIGGVAAGMSAAMEIYRTDESAEVTVLERGEHYSYGQCGLPYVINDVIPSIDNIIVRTAAQFREKYNIDARINTTVTEVDTENQEVHAVQTKTNEAFKVSYDRLLVASGADPFMPEWEGVHLEGIHPLKTITDGESLMNDLTEDVKNVTIVGGGSIGLEMAESFKTRGLGVTLIQRSQQLSEIFDGDMAQHIHQEAEKEGIQVVLGENVQGFTGEGRVEKVITEKNQYEADLVLIAIGVRPNTEFMKKTGIQMLPNGAITVNPYMETSIKNIYAAGDCAAHYHRIKKVNDYIPLGTTANKQGRIAGANMAGNTMTFEGITGTAILKFFNLTLGRTGLSKKEASRLKLPYEEIASKANAHAGYYPGSEKLHLKILYNKKTNKLLGGQVIGEAGADKRIDVLATALYANLTITQLLDLDLSYSPPYNGVWDPLQQIARKTGLA